MHIELKVKIFTGGDPVLQLKDIVKKYGSGENIVTALDGVSVTFRESEFVAILGHSGCGKTTLLNIIGGLDHYTSGDLIINGTSTKEYKDRDWDAYRNHSIGFIFQNVEDVKALIKYKNLAEMLENATDAHKRISDNVRKLLLSYLSV